MALPFFFCDGKTCVRRIKQKQCAEFVEEYENEDGGLLWIDKSLVLVYNEYTKRCDL